MDIPKFLGDVEQHRARTALLSEPHIWPLTEFVERIRSTKGPDYGIPYFDPLDGGVDAKALFLLEAPGPKAIRSGFISRNNPDETAKNFYLLNQAVQIDRRHTITWNAVPWYIGSGARIRAATRSDVSEAEMWLDELLDFLPRLRCVVFVGKKALHAKRAVLKQVPGVAVFEMPHPSPMFINRAPTNRQRALSALEQVAEYLASSDA